MRRILLLVIGLSGLLALGCQSKNQEPMTTRDEWNRQRFATSPTPVAEGFMRDYPDAAVTSVIAYGEGSGRAVRRVDFIRNGDTDLATYFDTGERISPPIPPIIAN